jgi:hypothetical protein
MQQTAANCNNFLFSSQYAGERKRFMPTFRRDAGSAIHNFVNLFAQLQDFIALARNKNQ